MTGSGVAPGTLADLKILLASETLPDKLAAQGQLLLQRASAPVVIAVLGLPESGKSQVINLFVGDEFISGDAQWSSLQIGWGETERTVITRVDGTTSTRESSDLSVDRLPEPACALVEMPSAILKQITLVETALTGPAEILNDTFDRAVASADIILWCSQEFSEDEYALWERVPDAKKDHSFMVLTKADLLSEQCVLSETIEQTQVTVAEEFHSLIPVATVQAVKAVQTGDEDALRASGGAFLIKAIMDHVQTGRRADLDSAAVFLNRHGAEISQDITVDQGPTPVQTTAANGGTESLPIIDAAVEPISAAIVYLREQAETMVRTETEGDEKTAFILEQCALTSAKLAETMLEDTGEARANQGIVEDVMEAADVILLMQMESGVGAAVDALTVLLQLRRGFEAKIAA